MVIYIAQDEDKGLSVAVSRLDRFIKTCSSDFSTENVVETAFQNRRETPLLVPFVLGESAGSTR